METRTPAVFLDRDGVLNRILIENGSPIGPRTLEDFVLIPGAAEAVTKLKKAGYTVVVVTNQPELARRRLEPAVLERMHDRLRAAVNVDAIYVCPHDDHNQCNCRKPKAGMLLSAARDLNVDLSKSFMVGDRWRDIEAGRTAGCRTILVDYRYREPLENPPDERVSSLAEAADIILSMSP
jgi:D-glycero-D-manno-heptose 1,7-bisphosphate phosphatase